MRTNEANNFPKRDQAEGQQDSSTSQATTQSGEDQWVSSETNSTDYPLSAEDVNDPSQEGSVAVGSGLGIDE